MAELHFNPTRLTLLQSIYNSPRNPFIHVTDFITQALLVFVGFFFLFEEVAAVLAVFSCFSL